MGKIQNNTWLNVFTLLSLLSILGFAYADSPKLSIDHKDFDFGIVLEGAKVSSKFVLKNEGSADLKIIKSISKCGCTFTTLDSSVIPVGQTKDFIIDFDTSGFEGNKEMGVQLITNDDLNPSVDILIKGQIKPRITFKPKIIHLDKVIHSYLESSNIEFEALYQVTLDTYKPFNIEDIKINATSEFLKISDLKLLPNNQIYFTLMLNRKVPIGNFRENIIVDIKDSEGLIFSIPVIGKIISPLVILDNKIIFDIDSSHPVDSIVRHIRYKFLNSELKNFKFSVQPEFDSNYTDKTLFKSKKINQSDSKNNHPKLNDHKLNDQLGEIEIELDVKSAIDTLKDPFKQDTIGVQPQTLIKSKRFKYIGIFKMADPDVNLTLEENVKIIVRIL